jgi:hypothetical protein
MTLSGVWYLLEARSRHQRPNLLSARRAVVGLCRHPHQSASRTHTLSVFKTNPLSPTKTRLSLLSRKLPSLSSVFKTSPLSPSKTSAPSLTRTLPLSVFKTSTPLRSKRNTLSLSKRAPGKSYDERATAVHNECRSWYVQRVLAVLRGR